MAHVFVYGTLRRGGVNHHVLAGVGARWVANARTAEKRTVIDLGPYPALLARDEARDAAPIEGELFEVDDDGIEAIDAFEGVPDLYRRERIGVVTEAGPADAWAYVFAGGR